MSNNEAPDHCYAHVIGGIWHYYGPPKPYPHGCVVFYQAGKDPRIAELEAQLQGSEDANRFLKSQRDALKAENESMRVQLLARGV